MTRIAALSLLLLLAFLATRRREEVSLRFYDDIRPANHPFTCAYCPALRWTRVAFDAHMAAMHAGLPFERDDGWGIGV